MMASRKGYRDIIEFTDGSEMRENYYGLIARGKRFYISRYINIDDGQSIVYELSGSEPVEIQRDWQTQGWSVVFVERWIIGKIT